MGGPQQAPKGAGCAVRVTRQYLFCLARMRTPLVRNVARTLPRLSGRPRTLPPPGCCGERRPRGGKEDSLFLFADVAGGCVTRLLFFCPPAWEAWPCLPANMQGWRVVWATEDRLPPTRQASPPLKQHTCCVCAKGSTHGGQATEQNSGEAATASCGSAGGQEELFRC